MARKRLTLVISLAVFMAAALLVSSVAAIGTDTGNGAISGPHFNLNLIGVKKTDKLPNDSNSGARIFVNLVGNSKIYLTQGDTFNVLDADATDGRAEFMLPAPENQYNETGYYMGPGNYRVFIRELGKPGPATAKLSTCGESTDDVTGATITVCSLDNITLKRDKGRSLFQDVTRQLTTVYYYDALLQRYVRVDIFDDAFEDYLWSYDNTGLKHVQLRFYPIT